MPGRCCSGAEHHRAATSSTPRQYPEAVPEAVPKDAQHSYLLLVLHAIPAPRCCSLSAASEPSLPKVANAGGVAQHCSGGSGGSRGSSLR